MKDKTLDEMFDQLLKYEGKPVDAYSDDEDDDFITSKEIVKDKALVQEHPELVGASGPIEIDEDVHFKRYNKKYVHRYTETEMAKIKSECETVIVHDYSENDEYHLSDEERARIDALAEIRAKLGTIKRTYRNISQYITAMRIVVEAWEMIEEKENYLHSREEFFEMVRDGRIYHSGIVMPKMKGIDNYNMDLVIKYISNPDLDPADLAPIKQDPYDSWYDDEWNDETEEEEMHRLLDPDEVEFIINTDESNMPEIEVEDIKRSMLKGYDTRNILFSKTKKKKIGKKKKYYRDNLQDILKKIQNNPALRSDGYFGSSYMLTQSMFVQEKEEKSFWDKLYYDGSWTNKDELFLYDMAINEELANQKCPGDRFINYGERDLNNFFRVLEDNGMNVIELRRRMSMSEESQVKEFNKRTRRQNKKVEQALLQRVVKLNQSDKFKKLIVKAEKAINEEINNY